MKQGIKPIHEGDIIEVEIVSKGKNGDGLAYYGESRFVIFVPDTKKGDKVKVKISSVSKNTAFGEVSEDE
jgi:predicted RNA-binding protein with TRAM domain